MRIIFFGTYNTKTTPRVQVMIDGFRAQGIDVVECNVPLPINTAARVAIAHQPWRLPILLLRMGQCWIKLRRIARKLPPADAVVVGYLGHFDVHLARWLFRHTPIALDYLVSGSDTVRDRNVSGGIKDKMLIALDNSALRAADIVITDTQEHYDRLPDIYRDKGVVVLVGAPGFWFAAKQKRQTIHKPLQVIFFGVYTPLQGTPTIGKALGLLKEDVAVTMVGTGQDEAQTKKLAKQHGDNVKLTWIDWIESTKLPSVTAANDVCLGIFGNGPKSFRVIPNKIYQGASVGCAIITIDTTPAKRILGANAILVPAGDAPALAQAIDTLARDRAKLAKLQNASYALATQEFIPKKVVLPLLEKLQSAKP